MTKDNLILNFRNWKNQISALNSSIKECLLHDDVYKSYVPEEYTLDLDSLIDNMDINVKILNRLINKE